MKIELLIAGLTIFFIVNAYHDGKYVKLIKSWKKYYQMAGIGFVGLSAYVFMKKYPSHTRSLFTDASKMVKYMPIDKEAGDLITPLFKMTQKGLDVCQMCDDNTPHTHNTPQFKRMMNSGGSSNKRCVSETKKKFVAARQGWKCATCGNQLSHVFEVDHIVRLGNGAGGTNHVDNLEAKCRECHGQKTAMENL
tara:strand:+ start:6041 stop:6619 length:579 start_codon:yes stop_codon:yes gene_type:complete